MAAFLKIWDADVAHLHKELQTSEQRTATQQLIRNFDEKDVSGGYFAKDGIGFECEYFVMPYITDPGSWQFFEQLSANPLCHHAIC